LHVAASEVDSLVNNGNQTWVVLSKRKLISKGVHKEGGVVTDFIDLVHQPSFDFRPWAGDKEGVVGNQRPDDFQTILFGSVEEWNVILSVWFHNWRSSELVDRSLSCGWVGIVNSDSVDTELLHKREVTFPHWLKPGLRASRVSCSNVSTSIPKIMIIASASPVSKRSSLD